jgi:prohibitin 1
MFQRVLSAATTLGTAAIVAGVASDFVLYDVDAGQRAVIFDKFRGLQETPVGEGTHFRIPFVQEVRMVDIRSRPRSISSVTGTKDLQMVNISLRVLSRPEESALAKILKTIGSDFDERVLPVIGNEVLKAVVAQHNAEELLSKRANVSKEIRDALIERAAKYDLILDDVAITHLTFGREFSKAIENKQVAQQEAETQAYVVMKSDQERKAAIIRAEGEAEAAELISKAMAHAGNGLIEVRRIDTAKEVAQLLSRSQNVTFLPGGGKNGEGSNILLNVGK